MERVIKLKSLMDEDNYLKRLSLQGKASNTYLLVSSFYPVKVLNATPGQFKIKPRGSHAITEGEILEEANALVDNIVSTTLGFAITFVPNEEKKVV